MKSCNSCQHFNVCKQMKDNSDFPLNDWDNPGGADWIKRLWELLAERCTQYLLK